jgi:hypothetical protein
LGNAPTSGLAGSAAEEEMKERADKLLSTIEAVQLPFELPRKTIGVIEKARQGCTISALEIASAFWQPSTVATAERKQRIPANLDQIVRRMDDAIEHVKTL